MADTVLQSFVIKLRYEFDEAAAKKFRDGIANSVSQLNAFRLSVLGAIVGVEELVRRTTSGMSQLSYAARGANVSAQQMEEFRAALVGAGRSAEEAGPILTGLFAKLRDPAQREAIKAFVTGGRDVSNGFEIMRLAVEKYRQALQAAGGNEQLAGRMPAVLQLKAALGDTFDIVRAFVLNEKQIAETKKGIQEIFDAIHQGSKVSADDMYRRSEEMERRFWITGQALRGVFAEFITSPAISKGIQDLTTAFGQWLISKETQQAIGSILRDLTEFFGPEGASRRQAFVRDLTLVRGLVSDLAFVVHKVWEAFKWLEEKTGPEWAAGIALALIALRRRIMGFVIGLGVGAAKWLFEPMIAAAAPAGVAIAAALRRAILAAGLADLAWQGGKSIYEHFRDPEGQRRRREQVLGPTPWWASIVPDPAELAGKAWHWITGSHAAGGIVPSALHPGEMVLPAGIASGIQGFFAGGGGSFVETSRRLLSAFVGWFSGDASYRPQVELGNETLERMGFHQDGSAGGGGGRGGGELGSPLGPGVGVGGPDQPQTSGTTGRVPLTLAQMKALALKAGFSEADASRMAAIAMAESGGRWWLRGGAGEYGLTQILPGSTGGHRFASEALDPLRAFQIAKQILGEEGWRAWSVYKNNRYLQYLPQAQLARPEEYNPGGGTMPALSAGGGAVKFLKSPVGVNAKLVEALQFAQQALGFPISVTSTTGGHHVAGSAHYSGNALDIQIGNTANKGAFGGGAQYAQVAHQMYEYLYMKYGKAIADRFAWGGEFETVPGSGVADWMHMGFQGRGRRRRGDWAFVDPQFREQYEASLHRAAARVGQAGGGAKAAIGQQHNNYYVYEQHSPDATAKRIKYTQDRSLAALIRNNRAYIA